LKRFGEVVLFLVTVLLALGSTELVLRLGGWGTVPGEAHAHLLRYDPALGWIKIPNGSVVYRWAGHRIRETSNSFGGRGAELGSDTGTNHRVLFLGDSFCEGYLVGDDQVFSFVLTRLQPTLRVVNLGVAGYSTDQEFLLYRRVGAPLNSQRVVVLFFDNDVWFNSVTQEYRARKPLFEMTDVGLNLTGIPVPRPDPRVAAALCADCPSSIRLLQLISRARGGLFRGPLGGLATPAVPAEMQIYHRSETPEILNAWRLTEALLGGLRESTGNRLTIFYVPTASAIYDASWKQTKRRYAMDEQWDIHLPERRLAEMCDRLGIPFISPTPRFRERAQRGEILYFMQDGHWNASGHRLVAEILSQYFGQGFNAR
jgi:hypothetical protein